MTNMKNMLTRLLLGGILAVVLAGCGDDDDDPARSSSASATIGPAGGTINGPDGVQMVVPAGALTEDTTLTIARVKAGAPAGPAGYSATTPIYEFTPHGQVFARPVTLRMPYTAPAGADDARVFMASPDDDWQAQEATVNDGMAEWQRLTLSYGAMWGCTIPANNTDPYPCTWGSLNAPVAADPVQAMTDFPYAELRRRTRLRRGDGVWPARGSQRAPVRAGRQPDSHQHRLEALARQHHLRHHARLPGQR
jgi:hypothetical protein